MEIKIESKNLKTIIFLFPIIFTLFMYWLKTNHYSTYEIIGQEDHIIEYSQFFFFLIGGIIAFLIAIKFKPISKLMFFLFLFAALGLIGVAGEEISWGERILNIQAPEAFDGKGELPLLGRNVQGEMNLHNFEPIHNIVGYLYLTVGSYLIFAYPLKKLIEKFLKITKNIKNFLVFLTPPPVLIPYFIPVGINLLNREEMGLSPQDYEMVEFLFSLGILIFLVLAYLHLNQRYPFLSPNPKGRKINKKNNAITGRK